MSSTFDTAGLQWRTQYAAMRGALAELKLDQFSGNIKPYGEGIMVDDVDLIG